MSADSSCVSDALAGLRAFVDETVVPAAAGWDRAGEIPQKVIRGMGGRLWLASMVPRAEGGLGLDMVSYGRLHEELGRGCSSLRCSVTAHDMVAYALWRWGEAEPKASWLPRMISGDAIGGFALSESEAGSDVAAIASEARPDGDAFVLNGGKCWVSNGTRADVFLVFARTSAGAGAFLVPRETPGMTISAMGSLLGVRAAGICEMRFDDCRVRADAMVGSAGAGLRFVLPAALALGRYAVASGCVGMARACLDAAIGHAIQRRQAGVILASHQLVGRMLARGATGVRAAELLCRACGQMLEGGVPHAVPEAAMAKYFASGVARDVAEDAVQIFGGKGCLEGNAVERFFRDSKVMEIIEGTNQVLEIILAKYGVQGHASRKGKDARG